MIKKITFFVASLFIVGFSCSKDEPTNSVPSPSYPTGNIIKNPASIGTVGDTSDVQTIAKSGVLLAGGSTDVDEAMQWLNAQANKGDVVIIRASGSVGYNQYLYDFGGVNSVETLLIDTKILANNPQVANRIKQAEVLFIAGGDQANYVNFWKGTLVEEAINYLINTKKVTVGGTSAGCAILGDVIFDALNGTITSAEALQNPYHSKLSIQKGEFIKIPFLKNTITDTHYNNPDRKGRHLTFMARMAKENNIAQGIGIEEKTAVAINDKGFAMVFGFGNAHFLINTLLPERCAANQALSWNNNQKAVLAYTIMGSGTGNGTFDLNTWKGISGGTVSYFYAESGVFYQK